MDTGRDTLMETINPMSWDISEQSSKHLSGTGTADFASQWENKIPWLFMAAIL